jgi:hypothetical protein
VGNDRRRRQRADPVAVNGDFENALVALIELQNDCEMVLCSGLHVDIVFWRTRLFSLSEILRATVACHVTLRPSQSPITY